MTTSNDTIPTIPTPTSPHEKLNSLPSWQESPLDSLLDTDVSTMTDLALRLHYQALREFAASAAKRQSVYRDESEVIRKKPARKYKLDIDSLV